MWELCGNHGELLNIKKEPGIKPDSYAPNRFQDDEARGKIISHCFWCVNRRFSSRTPSSDFRNDQVFKVIAYGCPVHVYRCGNVCVFHSPRDAADGNLFIFLGQFTKTQDFR